MRASFPACQFGAGGGQTAAPFRISLHLTARRVLKRRLQPGLSQKLQPSNGQNTAVGAPMMRAPASVRSLETLGRVRLSHSFFMRDFLHSEIANFYGVPNIPEDPDQAIAAGRRLCEDLLEPLQAAFGRLAIRSAYRSAAVNAYGNAHHQNCASNERNHARHIWDCRDGRGGMGAMACIVVPWF